MATWAVLIGINFYVKNRHLKGAVRDVEDIESYLVANIKTVRSSCFTASAPQDVNGQVPMEKPSAWPTFENITAKLEEIEQTFKQGDFLYLHFSGHGTQQPTTSPEYMEHDSSDLALVLFDAHKGARYLRGLDLARLLGRMTDRGLKVTIVLDCCYSGSVTRRDGFDSENVRGLDWDPAIDAASPSTYGPDASNRAHPVTRNALWSFSWLQKPLDYTLITACGPHEKACEGELDGLKHGVLSYLLLSTLNLLARSGICASHDSIYGYLCAKFHTDYPQQNPMLLGNRATSFLGDLRPTTLNQTEIFKNSSGSLCLRVGHAHGVYENDEYDVYPFGSVDSQRSTEVAAARVRVTTARGITSDVVEIPGLESNEAIRTGWKARPLTHFSARKAHVRIPSHLGSGEYWKQAIENSNFLQLSPGDLQGQPCLYNISINDYDEYEILDTSGQKVINIPTVLVEATGAITCVVQILEHIAKFKSIEGLENRSSSQSLENSFSVDILDSRKDPVKAAGVVEVLETELIYFTFRNNSKNPLYLTLYGLNPQWQVEGLLSSGGGGDYWVIQPRDFAKKHTGLKQISMKMLFPEEIKREGQTRCEDVIKLFVTTRPTSFKALALPKIQVHEATPMRGKSDQLSKFLEGLAVPHRGNGEATPLKEDWATRNYIIRTIAKDVQTILNERVN